MRKYQTLDNFRQNNYHQDFQFYISRYPFPHCSIALQAKYYKTFYECQGFQLTNQKLSRITSLNKLPSLIKLKQIGKHIAKSKSTKTNDLSKISMHSYSLFYQIVPHFVLSAMGISIIKSMNSFTQYRKLFKTICEDIENLISQRIVYIIDIQNIGVTMGGQIKFYIPANNILEDSIFTDKHEYEMRLTVNATIECIIRNLQNHNPQKGQIDVQLLRHQIKRQLQKNQLIPKTIQSQIFTFNQKLQSQDQKQQLGQLNEELKKTVKIRKSSQKIQFVPAIDFNLLKHSLSRDFSKHHTKCITSRQYIHHQEQGPQTKRQGQPNNFKKETYQIIYQNPHKQNEILRQKMKDYEEKLLILNNTVRQMKYQILTMSKKQKNTSQSMPKNINERQRSKTLTNLSNIDESKAEDISCMADKLSTSKIQIKKLLNDDTYLKKSFHVDQQINEEINLQKQIQNILNSNNPSDNSKKQNSLKKRQKCKNNVLQNKNEKKNLLNKNNQRKQSYNLRNLKENSNFQINKDSNTQSRKNKKSPNSYDYQSSLGKYSPPGGNPFRQYGNVRIQYVIDEQNKSNKQSQKRNQNLCGHIQVHPEPIVQPYKIVRTPVKKEHFFYPVVHIRNPYRYSCLAIPKDVTADYEYIAIPENMYDPTQYDSIDTFQMELGHQQKMPQIVRKDAFRHTLFPSSFISTKRPKTNKKIKSKQKDKSFSGSIRRQQHHNRIHESAGSQTYAKYIKPFITRQYSPRLRDNTSDRKSSKNLPNIRQAPSAYHEISMQKSKHSYRGDMLEENQRNQSYKKMNKISPFKGQIKQNGDSSRLSKTLKDVTQLIRKDRIQESKQQKQLMAVLSRGQLNYQKKKIDKQKLNAVLNKSKEIISKYKQISYKKN